MKANLLVHELSMLGLTQKEIERRSGVGQSIVSALKTGRRGKQMPYETVIALERLRDEVVREKFSASVQLVVRA